jgi:nitrate reductase, beta subunit
MDGETIRDMYRLLAIAKYDDRYAVPTAQTELPRGISELEGCPVAYDVEAFHGAGVETHARPEGRRMLPLEVIR